LRSFGGFGDPEAKRGGNLVQSAAPIKPGLHAGTSQAKRESGSASPNRASLL